MTLPRRRFLHLAAGAAALPAAARIARADTYPSRPVHLAVGFGPGSASDINARLVGQWLAQRLGQNFIVDNRAGAGGNIASDYVIHAAPDGYTLLYASTAVAINTTLYAGQLDFDFPRDTVPVAAVVRTPVVMEVNNDIPAKTVPGYEASGWQGVCAPKGTSADIVDKLNHEINAGLTDADFKGKLAKLGGMPFPGTPADWGKFIASETDKWGKVVREAGVKAE